MNREVLPEPDATPSASSIRSTNEFEGRSEVPVTAKSTSRLPLWLMTLGAGIVAGAISGQAGEATIRLIPMTLHYPANFASIGGYQRDAVLAMIAGDALQVAARRRAAVAYGILGLLLGIGLGLTGGWASGSRRSGLSGAVVGGVVGAIVGASVSALAVPLFFRFQDAENDATLSGLLLLFGSQAAIFSALSAAAGLGLGVGLGDRRLIASALIGGFLGAILGTFVFEAIDYTAYPMVRTYEPIPSEPIPRMLAHFCAAVGAGLLAGWSAGGERERLASKAPVKA